LPIFAGFFLTLLLQKYFRAERTAVGRALFARPYQQIVRPLSLFNIAINIEQSIALNKKP